MTDSGLHPDAARIRGRFPALLRQVRGRPIVYLDHACTTPRPEPVLAAIDAFVRQGIGCHGRADHVLGREATQVRQASREVVRQFVGAAHADEIVFVRNATDALNLVAQCVALKPGDAVLTTDLEHNSNLLPWQRLARVRGIRHIIHRIDPVRGFDRESFLRDLTPDVRLVSVFHVSNLCGIELPVSWIAREVRRRKAITVVDGAQAVTTHRLDVAGWGVDFYAFSFHKMFGPTGIGALYGRREILERLPPYRVGGDTVLDTTFTRANWAPVPQRFEAGVADVDGEVGAAAAAVFVRDIDPERIRSHAVALNQRATAGLLRHPRVRLVGPPDAALRNGILNFHVEGLDSRSLAGLLDERANVMVRYGRHCVHAWFEATGTPETVRASFSVTNTPEDAERLVATVQEVLTMIG